MSSTQAGPVLVNSGCAPEGLQPFGFVLGCGGMLTNGGKHSLQVDAEVGPAPGGTLSGMIPAPASQRLAPGASLTLPAPGPGAQWVVVYMTRATALEVVGGVTAGLLILTGLAGVGAADIVRHLRRKKRR